MEILVGIIAGFLGTIVLLALLTFKPSRLDNKTVNKMLKEAELVGSIKYRFDQADKLSNEQFELLSKLDQPNKSASHAHWKNEIVNQVEELEKNKIEIFKSMLEDGIDPYLTTMNSDGQTEQVRMSEAIKMAENNNDAPQTKVKKTDPKSSRDDVSNVIDFAKIRKEKKRDKRPNPEIN